MLCLLTSLEKFIDVSISDRKIRHKEEVKTSIIDAAWATMQREGWQALSIRKIAAAIEYSVPVIYDHFENKEAILLELRKIGFRRLNKHLKDAKEKIDRPELQIEAIGKAYLKFALNNKNYYQLMYGLGMPIYGIAEDIPELNILTRMVMEPVEKLVAGSKNANADAVLKLQAFWCMLHGIVSLNIFTGTNKRNTSQQVFEDFISTFIACIKK